MISCASLLSVLLTSSSREFLLVVHVNLMKSHHFYTSAAYEVHAFKNENERKSLLRDPFVYHFLFYICLSLSSFPVPILDKEKKIKLNFYFHTSFEAPQRSAKINI